MLAKAFQKLAEAGVPPLYRLGLGLRWGFISPESGFTSVQLGLIIAQHIFQFRQKPDLNRYIDIIEYRSSYRLWKVQRSRPSGAQLANRAILWQEKCNMIFDFMRSIRKTAE
jgi:hypothetical protein